MFASFNYSPPSRGVIAIGIVAGVVVLLVVGYIGKVRAGVGAGGVAGFVLSWYVLGRGVGDLTGFTTLIWSPAFAVLGMILGGAAAGCGMAWQLRQERRRKPKKRRREIEDPF